MRSAAATGKAHIRRLGPEAQLQKACLAYLKATLPHGFVPVHVANNPRSKGRGGIDKSLGALAGFPDLVIFGQREHDGQATAWFIEFKSPTGRLKPHQTAVHDSLQDLGFPRPWTVRSLDDLRRAVWNWGLPSKDATLREFATGRAA